VARISQIISLFALGFQKLEKSLGSIARGSDGSRMIVAGGVYGEGTGERIGPRAGCVGASYVVHRLRGHALYRLLAAPDGNGAAGAALSKYFLFDKNQLTESVE
jgi:hypothetical protein